jgi:acetolactate synthase-1/3 small subunit
MSDTVYDHVPPRAVPGGGNISRHVLVATALDHSGVLNRVTSLMRARGFSIDSIVASRTDRPGVSRMTIVLRGDDQAIEQAAKQLYKLIDVLKVQDVTGAQVVEHELALIKVRAGDASRAEVIGVVAMAGAAVVDVSADSVIVEAHGSAGEIDELVLLLRGYGIREMARTGATAMLRGAGSIEDGAGE